MRCGCGCGCECVSIFSSGFRVRSCARLVNPSMSSWYCSSFGGYSSSQYAGSGWNHNWKCTARSEGNFFDKTRYRGCKGHVGKLQQRQGSVSEPRSHQRYTAREVESRTTRTTSSSRKMIEAMGDDEHTSEYKKLVERDAEKLRSSSTDNISLALRIGSKQNLTDKDEKKQT